MKVFLSWSGSNSHKVAIVLRDWLPSVIQAVTPYVSSEDIDKGARWSTDIAEELEDSAFGILCVTKENIDAPWLTFEAGALSKTMEKSFVSPFLFDIKRSEVDGPLLQFQSTIFEKEDIEKLIKTINKACDPDGLTEERLNKAFEVWYPTLENELNKLKNNTPKSAKSTPNASTSESQDILEEVLELSRSNQKLIRNPEGQFASKLEEIYMMLKELHEKNRRFGSPPQRRRKWHPVMFDELFSMISSSRNNDNGFSAIQFALSLIKNDMPWIYDIGSETLNIFRSNTTADEKRIAFMNFEEILEMSFDHPIMRDMFADSKDNRMMHKEILHLIRRGMQKCLESSIERNKKPGPAPSNAP